MATEAHNFNIYNSASVYRPRYSREEENIANNNNISFK